MLLIGLSAWTSVFANTVRTVLVNNDAMAPIFLKIGKSTVLRFPEKPKKVVVGNQNYYGLEFIENDVAIQPLGAVATNLFVYTNNHTYGFLLTPGEKYDDLVFVRWKYPPVGATTTKAADIKETRPNVSFKIGGSLKISVERIKGPSTFGLYIVDCNIENVGKTEVSIEGMDLRAFHGGKPLDGQSAAIESEIVLKLSSKEGFTIEAKLGKWAGMVPIGRKNL